MNWLARIFIAGLLPMLVQCGGANFAMFNPDGTPKLLASMDGLLDDADATAREQTLNGPNGWKYSSRSIQQNPSRTKLGAKIIDGYATMGVANALSRSETSKANAERDVQLKKEGMKPNPNDGIVETEAGVFTEANSFPEEVPVTPQAQ